MICPNRSPLKSDPSDESDVNKKRRLTSRKKKKEKKKKRRHQHHGKTRGRRGQSGGSASESDAGSGRDGSSRGPGGGRKASEKPRYVLRPLVPVMLYSGPSVLLPHLLPRATHSRGCGTPSERSQEMSQ